MTHTSILLDISGKQIFISSTNMGNIHDIQNQSICFNMYFSYIKKFKKIKLIEYFHSVGSSGIMTKCKKTQFLQCWVNCIIFQQLKCLESGPFTKQKAINEFCLLPSCYFDRSIDTIMFIFTNKLSRCSLFNLFSFALGILLFSLRYFMHYLRILLASGIRISVDIRYACGVDYKDYLAGVNHLRISTVSSICSSPINLHNSSFISLI